MELKKVESGVNLRAVYAALERAGARSADTAKTGRELSVDPALENMEVNSVSNTLSYLHLSSRVLGRNWGGAAYAYYIMRPLEERNGGHREEPQQPVRSEPRPRIKGGDKFVVKIDGPGLVVERTISAELASRIMALVVTEGV